MQQEKLTQQDIQTRVDNALYVHFDSYLNRKVVNECVQSESLAAKNCVFSLYSKAFPIRRYGTNVHTSVTFPTLADCIYFDFIGDDTSKNRYIQKRLKKGAESIQSYEPPTIPLGYLITKSLRKGQWLQNTGSKNIEKNDYLPNLYKTKCIQHPEFRWFVESYRGEKGIRRKQNINIENVIHEALLEVQQGIRNDTKYMKKRTRRKK